MLTFASFAPNSYRDMRDITTGDFMEILKHIPLIPISWNLFSEKEVSVSVLRMDEIHPYISGNKWFKLKYNLEEFFRLKKKYFVTFGGAFSNHIIATAAAGNEYGIQTVGIIRGDELNADSNPALQFASGCGMKLFFVSREEYRQMRENEFIIDRIYNELSTTNFELYLLPEGGTNLLAVKGCAEIVNAIQGDFDYICCACGTGATLAGISTALNENQRAIGISVLNGQKFLEETILNLNGGRRNFRLLHDYSFGGYAKSNTVLDSFCENFFREQKIKIEPMYTGKLFYAIYELIKRGFFKKGERIIAVHSGGVLDWLVKEPL